MGIISTVSWLCSLQSTLQGIAAVLESSNIKMCQWATFNSFWKCNYDTVRFIIFAAENCLLAVYENVKYYILATLLSQFSSTKFYFSLAELILSIQNSLL